MGTRTGTIASVAANDIAAEAKRLLLEPRENVLKHRAPRDKGVHQRRRNIAAGIAQPFEKILEQSITDLLDGVPVDLLVRPFEAIIADLRALADATHDDILLPVIPTNLRETRAQAALDEAQMKLLADPDNPELAADVLAKAAAYRATLERVEAVAERVVTSHRSRFSPAA